MIMQMLFDIQIQRIGSKLEINLAKLNADKQLMARTQTILF